MNKGKNLLNLYGSAMPCSHATGSQFVQNSSVKHFLSQKYLQQIELLQNSNLNIHRSPCLKQPLLTIECQILTRSYRTFFYSSN